MINIINLILNKKSQITLKNTSDDKKSYKFIKKINNLYKNKKNFLFKKTYLKIKKIFNII